MLTFLTSNPHGNVNLSAILLTVKSSEVIVVRSLSKLHGFFSSNKIHDEYVAANFFVIFSMNSH